MIEVLGSDKVDLSMAVDEASFRTAGRISCDATCRYGKQCVIMTCRETSFKRAAKPDVLPSIAGAPPVHRTTKICLPVEAFPDKEAFQHFEDIDILSQFQNGLIKCKFYTIDES